LLLSLHFPQIIMSQPQPSGQQTTQKQIQKGSSSTGDKSKAFLKRFKRDLPRVQVFGKKKTAIAVAQCVKGKGIIKVNGVPIELVQPEILRYKLYEPVFIVGQDKFRNIDIRIRVRGGGKVSQIYAIRQAIGKALIAFYQKYVDEASKRALKEELLKYDRSLLVTDPRQREPKKFGGPKARARYTRSFR